MNILSTQNPHIVYRRWTLLIPVLMIMIGIILIFIANLSDPIIGLLGGVLVLIGVLTLGALLSVVLGIELAARMLAKKDHPPLSFREKMEANELLLKEKEKNES